MCNGTLCTYVLCITDTNSVRNGIYVLIFKTGKRIQTIERCMIYRCTPFQYVECTYVIYKSQITTHVCNHVA